MRYFQHANGPFPNTSEEAFQTFLDLGGKPYVLKFDGEAFFIVDSTGEYLSPYQDIVGCQTYVERGIWVEIPANPFEKTA